MSLLQNDDRVVRASVVPVPNRLSDRELAPLLPDLIKAIEVLAPSNEMWGDDIRQAGPDILSRRHIREGMDLCVSTIEWRWGLAGISHREIPAMARPPVKSASRLSPLPRSKPTACGGHGAEPKAVSRVDFWGGLANSPHFW